MADIDKIGRKLSEVDRRVNMNASSEDFAKYLVKHNICITKEIYEELKINAEIQDLLRLH
jgi:hypothetical protein